MRPLLSLLKCTFTALALFGLGMTAAVTVTLFQGYTADGWTFLPLPIAAMASLLCLSGALSAANAEL